MVFFFFFFPVYANPLSTFIHIEAPVTFTTKRHKYTRLTFVPWRICFTRPLWLRRPRRSQPAAAAAQRSAFSARCARCSRAFKPHFTARLPAGQAEGMHALQKAPLPPHAHLQLRCLQPSHPPLPPFPCLPRRRKKPTMAAGSEANRNAHESANHRCRRAIRRTRRRP